MNEERKELEIVEQGGAGSFIAPVVNVPSALARYSSFKEFVSKVLEKGRDYGEIPGTNKPTLLKPGAEKLGAFFGLRPIFALQESVNDWTGKDHGNEPFFFREYKCQLYRNGELVGEGIGSCNSWEKKYRYRWMNELEIPAYVDKSGLEYKDGSISEFSFAVEKAETSGKYGKPASYWQQFQDAIANGTAKRIQKKAKDKTYDAWEIGGKLYAVPNRDVADQVNTIDKMAQKRAFVAAILIATNASDYFTQDMEDFSDDPGVVDVQFKDSEPTVSENQSKPASQPMPSNGKRPYEPEIVKSKIEAGAKVHEGKTATQPQVNLMVGMLDVCFASGDAEIKRHEVCSYLTGEASSKKITGNYVIAMLDWLKPEKVDGGEYKPDPMATKEAQAILTARAVEAGQQQLI